MEDEDALTLTLGIAFTVIVFETLAEQPAAFVPVTEYVVVVDGLTVMEAVVAPLLHKYDDAPLAVRVADAPTQIADGALTLTVGTPLTTILTLPTAEQPFELVPVTL